MHKEGFIFNKKTGVQTHQSGERAGNS